MTKKIAAKKKAPGENCTEDVNEFMSALDHPFKQEIEAVRALILEANSGITESIKWNAPSFYFNEYFATFHLRAKECIQVILHQGAKVKDNSSEGIMIHDETSLLEWLAKERCSVKFYGMKDIAGKKAAFQSIIKQWILLINA